MKKLLFLTSFALFFLLTLITTGALANSSKGIITTNTTFTTNTEAMALPTYSVVEISNASIDKTEIRYKNQTGTVPTSDIKELTETNHVYMTTKSTIFKIISETEEQTEKILEANTQLEFFMTLSDVAVVKYQETIGTVSLNDVQEQVDWNNAHNILLFRTMKDTAIFVEQKKALIVIGFLQANQTFERINETVDYHIIMFGKQKAFILKKDTTTATEIPTDLVSGKQINKRGFTREDVVLTQLNEEKNTQLLTLNRSTLLTITQETADQYIIEIAGRKAYLAKTAVTIGTGNYVNPKTTYTYEQMKIDLAELHAWYPDFTELFSIGKSVDGRELYTLKLGTGKENVLINGSHHAREHMTTNVVMEMIDEYAKAYEANQKIDGYNVQELLKKTSIYFVPMLNPDGVTLVQKGYTSAKNSSYVLKLNGGKKDFSAWKANIRGVDLNRQYPAQWSTIKNDTGKPGPKNYKGPKPLSEPEVKALYDFTKSKNFKSVLAYHSSGQIIFWDFHQNKANAARDKKIADKLAKKTGYSLVKPSSDSGGGGYKDWFVQDFKKPGFTIEIAPYADERPVPIKQFDSIFNKNRAIGLLLANEPNI